MMTNVRKMNDDGITAYRFAVLERQGPLTEVGEAIRFSAVKITTDEDGDEAVETLGRFPTEAEASDLAKQEQEDFLRYYG